MLVLSPVCVPVRRHRVITGGSRDTDRPCGGRRPSYFSRSHSTILLAAPTMGFKLTMGLSPFQTAPGGRRHMV